MDANTPLVDVTATWTTTVYHACHAWRLIDHSKPHVCMSKMLVIL